MGVVERSREVMAVMALHEALRNVCLNSDWTYSVFWTIRPRPRLRGGLGCKAGDEGSLMLMWEDGYCRPAGSCSSEGGASDNGNNNSSSNNNNNNNNNDGLVGIHRVHSLNLGDDVEEEDPVRKAFRKMSIQLYNYGEGLMGKVASDKCHKWVFRESSESEVGPLNYWQSSFDSHPPEWMDQFSAGIQTIAVIQAGHGLLQLGSCKIVAEDLHFVLRMRYTFESLENQAGGGFLSQTFAPMRNRFFCGSPTGAPPPVAAPPAVAWQQNGQPGATTYFQTSSQNGQAAATAFFQAPSDFRLRLGVSSDAAAAAAVAINGGGGDHHHHHHHHDSNITSLRLSLQNGSPGSGAGDRTLSFDFRPCDEGGGGDGVQSFSGMKRPHSAGSPGGPVVSPGTRGNLLARRMQYNNGAKVTTTTNNNTTSNGHPTSFQELLQSGGNYSAGVFHTSNGGTSVPPGSHDGLMVQIPPVISAGNTNNNTPSNNSPMVSPGGSNKVQRTGNMSPMIQAALQEALERASSHRGSSTNCPTSPLAVRLSKLTEQAPYLNGTGTSTSSHPGTPNNKHPNSEVPAATGTPSHSQYSGSHPSTPSNKDNYLMNNNNANGCLVDHSSAPGSMLVDSNGGGGGGGGGGESTKQQQSRGDPLHIPTAAWENLKESLELPNNGSTSRRPAGEMYPDFMDSFFE